MLCYGFNHISPGQSGLINEPVAAEVKVTANMVYSAKKMLVTIIYHNMFCVPDILDTYTCIQSV